MKRIFNITAIIILTISFSCTDFLLLEPQDELIREEYWKSEGDVIAVLGTAYSKLNACLDDVYYWAELRGGLLSPDEKRVKQETYDFFNYNLNENNEKVKWGDFYSVINIANTIIEYAPLAKENDNTFSQKSYDGYLAEAYFIRSWCYFTLVKSFKDVPFVLKSYSTDEQSFLVKKEIDSVIINHLIKDLTDFEDKAFEQEDFSGDAQKKGRVTKNAIYSLLAEIYLWNNEFNNCIKYCDKIEDIYLVEGPQYFTIFGNEGNSVESILELQFDYDLYETTNDLYKITSQNSEGTKETVVSEFLMELYNTSDYRQYDDQGRNPPYSSTDLYIWKYEGDEPFDPTPNAENIGRTNITSDANWIFYRLADIYLMKAEAYAEKKDFANAVKQLNVVKSRAGLADYVTDNIQLNLLEEIINERAREFVGEGKRWFDLVRITRRDKDNRLKFISEAVIPNVDTRSRSAVAAKIKDINSWFLPIYFNELQLNKELVQNSFYE